MIQSIHAGFIKPQMAAYNSVRFRNVSRHLRFDESRMDALYPLTPGYIQNLYAVIPVDGSEYAIAFRVHPHVVESPLDVRHGNDSYQNERSKLIIRWSLLPHSSAREHQ